MTKKMVFGGVFGNVFVMPWSLKIPIWGNETPFCAMAPKTPRRTGPKRYTRVGVTLLYYDEDFVVYL